MSMQALLTACKSRLVTDLGSPWDSDALLDIEMPPGRPPAACGKKFIALWGSDHSPGLLNQEEGLDELFAITITLTLRTGEIPDDRLIKKALFEFFEPTSRAVVVSMVKHRWLVLQSANALIAGVNGFVEPLRWLGTQITPTPQGAEWFTAKSDSATDFGLSMDIRFGQARRIQTFANME